MKKLLLFQCLLIIVALHTGCTTPPPEVDGNDITVFLYIKNSLDISISSKLVGISSTKANNLGYAIETEIASKSTKDILKVFVGFNSIDEYVDAIHILDTNDNLIEDIDINVFELNSERIYSDDNKTVYCTYEIKQKE